ARATHPDGGPLPQNDPPGRQSAIGKSLNFWAGKRWSAPRGCFQPLVEGAGLPINLYAFVMSCALPPWRILGFIVSGGKKLQSAFTSRQRREIPNRRPWLVPEGRRKGRHFDKFPLKFHRFSPVPLRPPASPAKDFPP